MRATLLGLAEEPELHLLAGPRSETVAGQGFRLVASGQRGTVEGIRLGDDVEEALAETRALARARGITELTWWVGELATPGDLAERLLALGLEPADTPELTSLTIASRPAGSLSVEVLRVATLEQYLRALELDWEVWQVASSDREQRRGEAMAYWERLSADGRTSHHLAFVDGEPVGFGRVVFTPAAGLLLGGAVLPAARGRGVYTSLVHSRWDEAVERGVPRLIVGAGHMSAPILERLGFGRIGRIRLLRDRL